METNEAVQEIQLDHLGNDIKNYIMTTFGFFGDDSYRLKQLSEGMSGAAVYQLNALSPRRPRDAGVYILKLVDRRSQWYVGDDNEAARSRRIYESAEAFQGHLVKVKSDAVVGDWLVMLLSFALKGERDTVSAAKLSLNERLGFLKRISYDMLKLFNSGHVTNTAQGGMIQSICRFRVAEGGRFYQRLTSLLRFPEKPSFEINGEIYPNPGYYIDKLDGILENQKISYSLGHVHGDLHLCNILTRGDNYAIIDYDTCGENYLFYDQAYLELDNYRYISRDWNLDQWSEAMKYLFRVEDGEVAAVEYYSSICVEKNIREGIMQWCEEEEPNNADSLKVQLQLARVAAGITFFSRMSLADKVAEQKKYLIYTGSGLEALFDLIGYKWIRHDCTEMKSAEAGMQEVERLWKECAKFSGSYIKILITDDSYSTVDYQKIARIGYIDWRLIVDVGEKEPPSDMMTSLELRNHRVNVSEKAEDFLPLNNTGIFQWKKGERQRPFDHWKLFRKSFLPILRKLCGREPEKAILFVMDFHSNKCEVGNRLVAALYEEDYIPAGSRFACLGTYRDTLSNEDLSEKNIKCFEHRDADLTTLSRVVSAYELPWKPDGNHIFLPCIDTLDGKINREERDSYESCVELLYPGMERELLDYSDGVRFFRGNEASWSDLAMNNDVAWENYETWKGWLKEKLDRGNCAIFKLAHAPAAGGTTLSRRLMWDMKDSWPTLRIRKYTTDTANVIIDIYRKTGKCMLAIAEMGSSVISEEELQLLRRKVEGSSCRVVFLAVERTENRPEDGGGIYLEADLNQDDARKFYKSYAAKTEDQRRIRYLEKLTYDRENEEWKSQRCPFFYGFYTFQEEYEGIGRFLNSALRGCAETEKKMLSDLSIMTMYSQNVCMPAQEIAHRYGIEDWNYALIDDKIENEVGRLVVRREDGYRICHPIIADHLLQRIWGNGRMSVRERSGNLFQATLEFIENVHQYYSDLAGEYVDRILKELFIDRSYMDGEQQKFSALITDLCYLTYQTKIFEKLIEYYPENPHYYNHLGRLEIQNQQNLQFGKAVINLHKALDICSANSLDSTPHHTTMGCIYSRKVMDDLTDRDRTPEQMLDAISVDYAQAEEQFEKARKLRKDSSYGYFPHIFMICRVVESITKNCGRSLRSLKENDTFARWYHKHTGEALQLFDEMKRICGESLPEDLVAKAERRIAVLKDDLGSIKRSLAMAETGNLTKEEQCNVRRTAVMMFHMHNNYRWTGMPMENLRLAVSEMEKVLLSGEFRQGDVISWFQAYRQISPFDTGKAKQYLIDCMDESYRKNYYLWILSFKDYMDGVIPYEQVRHYLDACRNSPQLREDNIRTSRFIDVYMNDESGFPIQRFDSKPDENGEYPGMRLFTGQIVSMEGTATGTIRLDKTDEIRLTFVPSFTVENEKHEFTQNDLNARVAFYIGFTYSGYRAWNPVKILMG